MKLAVQVYSVRDHINDSETLLKALEEIKKIGYDGVEFAGYFDTDAATIKAKLDEVGLVAVGSHMGLDDFKEDKLADTIEFVNTLGLKAVGVGGAPHSTMEEAVNTGDVLGAAEKYAMDKYGIKVYYHNHCEEFVALENGLYPIDVIGDRCSLEIDTYWSFHAGQDNRVRIKNCDIELPCRARYGWQPFTTANLVNSDGLPASTFEISVR